MTTAAEARRRVQAIRPRTETERVAAGLWSRLNCWEWPEIDMVLRGLIMRCIESAVPKKVLLWEWNRPSRWDAKHPDYDYWNDPNHPRNQGQ